MIGYRAVPYLVASAPPIILLLTVLIGGCTMTRTVEEPVAHARFYSEPNSRSGDTLARELDRRAAREELRRVIEETRR